MFVVFFFFKVLSNPNHSVLVNCKWYVVAQQNYWYHQKVLAVRVCVEEQREILKKSEHIPSMVWG